MFFAVVPAYNEEKTIDIVVRGLVNLVDKVIVVDDGSTDNTFFTAKNSGAVVLRHKINRGQGAALQTGDEYAVKKGAEYVVHFDADGQFDPSDVRPALKYLIDNKADVLFGSRFLGKKSNLPFSKRFILFPFGKIINKIFGGIWLTDVHNGFRILNQKALEVINFSQDRMAYATEINAKIKFNNLKYVEFPVKVMYYEYGQGLKGGIQIIKDLFLEKFIN